MKKKTKLIMSFVITVLCLSGIWPPDGPRPNKRIPKPSNPPIIVVIPGGSK